MFLLGRAMFQNPQGLIVPINSLSLPSGWAWWNAANGSFLRAAGNSYAVGGTGGSHNVTAPLTAAGSHYGTNFYPPGGGGTWSGGYASATGGAHGHTLTMDVIAAHQALRMIQASAPFVMFPANAVLLTHENRCRAAVSNVLADNRLLRASADSISAAAQVEENEVCNTAGSHDHHSSTLHSMTGGGNASVSGGGSDHAFVGTVTVDVARAYLMAWSNNAAAFAGAPGLIAMWASADPPYGWMLCDGTGGTLDLRDYYVALSDDSNVGTRTGANQATFDGTTTSSGAHDHEGGAASDAGGSVDHSNTVSHDHTVSGAVAYTPPYYAITFIQRWR